MTITRACTSTLVRIYIIVFGVLRIVGLGLTTRPACPGGLVTCFGIFGGAERGCLGCS
jgi:hypothetical protein